MKDKIEKWLASDKQDYQDGLALLGPLIRNKYLFRNLSQKENKYNRAKLINELRKVVAGPVNKQPEKKAPVPAPKASAPAGSAPVPPVPAVTDEGEIDLNNMTPEQTAAAVEKLEQALSKMHNKKGILSNSLRNFDAKDNEGRKAVIDQINGLDEDMNSIRSKLDYYAKNGKLPPILPDKNNKTKEIPDDPVKMKEMLLNLRTSRTKIKKQLKEKNISPAEKEKLETRLKEKIDQITEIERRLNGR
jgi:hypothetical protein